MLGKDEMEMSTPEEGSGGRGVGTAWMMDVKMEVGFQQLFISVPDFRLKFSCSLHTSIR
jgi:hypothetical protein